MEDQNSRTSEHEAQQNIATVLVVDDDDNWCFISKRLLSKVCVGSNILTAKNGYEGFNKLKEAAANGEDLPELILLDIKMPVMDGFGFLDEVSKAPDIDLSRTKIYVCSSSLHPNDRERAYQYPTVSGFITKPLTKEIISEIVNTHKT